MDFVGTPLSLQFLLSTANRGYLGMGIDNTWDRLVAHRITSSEDMIDCDDTLTSCCMGKHRDTIDVTDGIDPRSRGLHVGINTHRPTL